MTAPAPTADLSFATCGICGDEHDCGLGYSPWGKDHILWACTDCLPIARDVYGVVLVKSKVYARAARDHAGQIGGAYLEKIGKFSLAELSEEEWTRFLDLLFVARADKLRELYVKHVAPF